MIESGAYIPVDRRVALARNMTLPDHDEGSALFIDIFGFTKLTELFLREAGSRKGAEELIVQINVIYTAIIADVHRYRGSVIGFSGDAILCWFGSHLDIQDSPAMLAISCAHMVNETISLFRNSHSSAGTRLDFDIKSIICSGSVRRFIVGDPEYQLIDVIAGSPIDRITFGTEILGRRELIVDQNTFDQIASNVDLEEKRPIKADNFYVIRKLRRSVQTASWQEIFPAHVTIQNEEQWVLKEVREFILDSQGTFVAELREAVALFLKFSGLDFAKDPLAPDKLRAYINKIQQVLRGFGGTLIQLTTGDKGSYLYATFGAPIMLSNSALQAVQAALEIQERSKQYEFIEFTQIGISMGIMRVGGYGSYTRATFGVIGGETNIAARLMSYAKQNQILVSERVYLRTSTQINYRVFSIDKLPDLLANISIYLCLGTSGSLDFHTPGSALSLPQYAEAFLVNRDLELGIIKLHLRTLLDKKQGGFLAIEGEDGLGKTPLLAAIAKEAMSLGLRVCVGSLKNVPHSPMSFVLWKGIFYSYIGVTPDNYQERGALIFKFIEANPLLGIYLPLLNSVFHLDLDETRETMRFIGKKRDDAISAFIFALFKDLFSRERIVLLVEAVNNADDFSIDLLDRLMKDGLPILYVLGITPYSHRSAPGLGSVFARSSRKHLRLRPFDINGTRQSLKTVYGDRVFPEELLRLIFGLCAGHPEFTLQIASENYQRYLEFTKKGRAEKERGDRFSIKIPDSVIDKISVYLDCLSPLQLSTIKVASVLGESINTDMLAAIHPSRLSFNELLDVLKSLSGTGMMVEVPVHSTYKIKYPIVSKVIYQRLLFAQRRTLHNQIAVWLEKQSTSTPDEVNLLANHWSMTGDEDRAVHYMEKAAILFYQQGNFREAVSSCLRIIRKHTDILPYKGANIRLLLAQCYLVIGLLTTAGRQVDESVDLLNASGDLHEFKQSNGEKSVSLIKKMFQEKTGINDRHVDIESTTDEVDIDRIKLMSYAFSLRAEIYYYSQEHDLIGENVLEAISLAKKSNDNNTLVRASILGSVYYRPLGENQIADVLHEQALANISSVSEKTNTMFQVYQSYHLLGKANWLIAEKMITCLVKDLLDKQTDAHRLGDALILLGWFFLLQGGYLSSRTTFRKLLGYGASTQSVNFQMMASIGISYCCLRSGRFSEAIEFGDHVEKLMDQYPHPISAMMNEGLLALAYFRLGNISISTRYASRLFERIQNITVSHLLMIEPICAAIEVYLSLLSRSLRSGQADEATQNKIDLLLRKIEWGAKIYPYWSIRYHYLLGVYLDALNKPNQASVEINRARRNAEAYQFPYENGKIAMLQGAVLTVDGNEDVYLSKALAIFKNLGADYDAHIASKIIDRKKQGRITQ